MLGYRGTVAAPSVGMDENRRDLAFGAGEYRRRLSDLRSRMDERGARSFLVVVPENVCYLSGYDSIGYSSFHALLVPIAGEPILLVREMELTVAQTTTWLSELETYGDIDDPVQTLLTVMRRRGFASEGMAVEQTGGLVSASVISRLLAGMPGALDGSRLVEQGRRIKSYEEIARIREACRITEAAMGAALGGLRPGVTENAVAAAAFGAMMSSGSDFGVIEPIVTSGWRSGVAHTTFANRELEPGDTVLLEMSGCRRRYFGPLMRGAVIAPVDPEVRRMAEAILAALEAALAAIRPGATSGAVDAACRSVLEEAGYEALFRKRTGYSVGVAYAPDWGEGHIVSLRRNDATVLEPGMVFHIPPALRVPRRYGLGFSETVLVTEGGCEALTRFPRELHIVD
ncbi:MAG: M24 family metallopeptidase [Vicinamibacteria bacterium]